MRRKNKVDKDGQARLQVTYIKFKDGDGTVHNICEEQNFCMLFSLHLSDLINVLIVLFTFFFVHNTIAYVSNIYDTMIKSSREELKKIGVEI